MRAPRENMRLLQMALADDQPAFAPRDPKAKRLPLDHAEQPLSRGSLLVPRKTELPSPSCQRWQVENKARFICFRKIKKP